ncbi:MAG: YihY/virulence factor BrkB family protein, partial [Williamsia herbipolensis]|nr:YihY/virulence factor BrkB family protein [Williamsia herbipolensis]
DAVLDVIGDLGSASVVDTLRDPVQQLVDAPSAGFALVIGVLGALWSASGYVGAFGRALNRMYEIEEGRPIWKLRPAMLLVTLVAVLMTAAVAFMLAVSGPIARSVGDRIGLGDTGLLVWNIARWPVILVFVVTVVAILYWATPNVRQPKFRWISAGALLAIVVWIVASALFAVYVANFASYNKTYGALAGVVVFLLWLWITNLALLFGAEFDSELERARELQAGLPAEEHVQLPPRDTAAAEKNHEKDDQFVERARLLRQSRGREE